MDAVYPVSSAVSSRVYLFDALRGFAVLMILFANIFAFAYPLELGDKAGLSDTMTQWSQLQHQLYLTFIRGKFICLLTLLFGASLFLLWQQAGSLRLKPRMLALMLLGFCHAVFVWSGDILLIYSLVASGLLWQRALQWPMAQQLSRAKTYLAAGLMLPLLIWLVAESDPKMQADTETLIALYTGPYMVQLWQQIQYIALIAVDTLLVSYWWFGGMMLLAFWALQSDWPCLLKRYFYPLLLLAVACAVLPLAWTGFSVQQQGPSPFQMISDLCFALVYIRLFILMLPRLPKVMELLRRCGRCSLSLYLWQSISMVALFRWFCPDWFGTVNRDTLTAIAAAAVMLQLLWVWLLYQPGQLWWCERIYRQLGAALEKKATTAEIHRSD